MLFFQTSSRHRNPASNKCGMDAMFLFGSVGASVLDWGYVFYRESIAHVHSQHPSLTQHTRSPFHAHAHSPLEDRCGGFAACVIDAPGPSHSSEGHFAPLRCQSGVPPTMRKKSAMEGLQNAPTKNYAETRDRTGDLQIFGLTLSQLSYRGFMQIAQCSGNSPVGRAQGSELCGRGFEPHGGCFSFAGTVEKGGSASGTHCKEAYWVATAKLVPLAKMAAALFLCYQICTDECGNARLPKTSRMYQQHAMYRLRSTTCNVSFI